MPKTTKPPKTRKNARTEAKPHKHYHNPTKAEMEQEFSFCGVTGTKPEDWGDTEEEQFDNMTRWTFRQIKRPTRP